MAKITKHFRLKYDIILSNEVGMFSEYVGQLDIEVVGYKRTFQDCANVEYSADVDAVYYEGKDVKKLLEAFGGMDKLQAAADSHVRHQFEEPVTTVEPREDLNAMLQQIIEALQPKYNGRIYTLKEPLDILVAPGKYHIVHGLTISRGQSLIVIDGAEDGHPLETTDLGADKMILAIYKRLAAIFHFPHNKKAA